MRAGLIFIITCAALYVIEYVLYDQTVTTVFIYAAIYPPLIVMLYYAFGRRRAKREYAPEIKKAQAAIAYALLAVCTVFTYYYVLVNNAGRLASWQILAIVNAIVIIAVLHKQRRVNIDVNFKADAVSIIYSMILLVTVLFLLIARP